MKIKFLPVITSLLAAAFMITSCLDSNEVETEYSSNASITAFSINDIDTRHTETRNGKDTTIVTTVIGKKYPFSIDQSKRFITNLDSLPVGTDITKVVASITADTPWIIMTKEDKDTVWTSTDSLNFETPLKFKVVAYSGVYGPSYTVNLKVHKQVPDSLQWTRVSTAFHKEIAAQKAVALGETIYVFAQLNDQTVLTTTSIQDGRNWTTPQTLNLPTPIDYTSAMAWGDHLYVLANADLYRSANGSTWERVNADDVKLSRLIANTASANNRKLYAINTDNHFVESENGTAWSVQEEVGEGFPTHNLSYASLPLVTNPSIERIAVMGNNEVPSDTTCITWSKLTTEKAWGDYPSNSNSNFCPKLAHISMIYYNDLLYTFGGPSQRNGKEIPAFSLFYVSKDQGITWQSVSRYLSFPDSFANLYQQADGNYSCVIDKNDFLWIIWSKSGEVWRGRINKLGFEQQE